MSTLGIILAIGGLVLMVLVTAFWIMTGLRLNQLPEPPAAPAPACLSGDELDHHFDTVPDCVDTNGTRRSESAVVETGAHLDECNAILATPFEANR